jgi:hypothetical protein
MKMPETTDVNYFCDNNCNDCRVKNLCDIAILEEAILG